MKKIIFAKNFSKGLLFAGILLAGVACSEQTKQNAGNLGESVQKDVDKNLKSAEKTGQQVAENIERKQKH
jgi:hypothetical protein